MILEAKGIYKYFGGLTAIKNVDFSVKAGSIASIIGPNGAGKTTFFNMISGFYRPSKGKIIFRGHDISQSNPAKLAAKGIARTFQNIRLFPELMAIENILIGRHLYLKAGLLDIIFKTRKVKEEEHANFHLALELLEYVGLKHKEKILAKNLSYGDQRRLEIARALATDPKLLLLDEPTAGMNPKETSEMQNFILRLREEKDLSILLIEHDMRVVMGISDYITVLNYGTKIAHGKPDEVRNDPEVITAYLGYQKE